MHPKGITTSFNIELLHSIPTLSTISTGAFSSKCTLVETPNTSCKSVSIIKVSQQLRKLLPMVIQSLNITIKPKKWMVSV